MYIRIYIHKMYHNVQNLPKRKLYANPFLHMHWHLIGTLLNVCLRFSCMKCQLAVWFNQTCKYCTESLWDRVISFPVWSTFLSLASQCKLATCLVRIVGAFINTIGIKHVHGCWDLDHVDPNLHMFTSFKSIEAFQFSTHLGIAHAWSSSTWLTLLYFVTHAHTHTGAWHLYRTTGLNELKLLNTISLHTTRHTWPKHTEVKRNTWQVAERRGRPPSCHHY